MNKYLFLCSLIFNLLLTFSVIGQNEEPCGFDETHKYLFENDEQFRKIQLDFEEYLKNRPADNRSVPPVYKVPVVVHVIHLGEAVGTGTNISDAQINSAISNLTTVFRGNSGNSEDIEIEFELATQDPNCIAYKWDCKN